MDTQRESMRHARWAVTMMVVAHVNGLWTNAEGFTWFAWRGYLGVVVTLHLDYQAGGFTGLLLFFLVSGYIVSQAAEGESRLEFAVKRAARLLPAMALAVALTLLVGALGRYQGWTEITAFNADRAFSGWSVLEAVGLGVTFSGSLAVLFVLWSLTVEYYWYALLGASIGPARDRPVVSTMAISAVVLLLALLARSLDGPVFIEPGHIALVFVILIGRWIYLHDRGTISLRDAVAGSLAMAGLYVLVQWQSLGSALVLGSFPRLLSIAWATLFFCLLLRLVKSGPWRPVAFIADISYGLYLFHIPVMFAVLPLISPQGRLFPVGLVLTLAATVGVAWLSYRFVETPVRHWARRLLDRRGPQSPSRRPAPVTAG